ncbi:MAG: thiamine-phosphate kinase [Alphaproteobacteria bacterium]
MQKLDFIADVLNPILDEDPLAVLVPVDGQALAMSDRLTQVMVSNTLIGGADFMPTDSPKTVAARLLRICVAELAAKGAVARNCSLVLCLNETANNNWINMFGVGLVNELQEFGLSIVSSETKTTKGPVVVSMSCVGELAGKPLSAKGARPGDLICQSGQAGLAALGQHIQAGADFGFKDHQNDRFVGAHLSPEPNWALGSFLLDQARARAAVNISTGLLPDLVRLALTSDVGINIDFSSISFADNSLPIGQQIFESPDHQLLFSVPAETVEHVRKWFPQVSVIGRVLPGQGVRLLDATGAEISFDRLAADRF